MPKLAKTELKLLARIDAHHSGRGYYQGIRETGAARKLIDKGICRVVPENGWYEKRNWDGSYSRKYEPQGAIYRVA